MIYDPNLSVIFSKFRLIERLIGLTDPCRNYHKISDSSRSITSDRKMPWRCDNLLRHQWYRFTDEESDLIIPMQRIRNTAKCGTISPGWMQGNLPKSNN